MRKLLFLLVAAVLSAQIISAQTKPVFKKLRMDVGLGIVSQAFKSSGAIFYWEPSYTLFNKWSIGVQMAGSHQEMKNIGSIQGTLDYNYIIGNSSVRLFAGGGLGYFDVAAAGSCGGGPSTTSTKRSTAKFGGMLRTGIRAGHCNLTVLYNFVPTTHVYDMDGSDKVLGSVDHANSHWGFTFGISIGGGRTK